MLIKQCRRWCTHDEIVAHSIEQNPILLQTLLRIWKMEMIVVSNKVFPPLTLERNLSLDEVRLVANDMLADVPFPEALWDTLLELLDVVFRRLFRLPFPC